MNVAPLGRMKADEAPARMDADPLGFLLDPVTPEAFFAEHYEQKPLIGTRGGSDRFGGLLSIEVIDAFLASVDLHDGMLNLAKGGSPVPADRYVAEDGRINPVAVAREYAGGATIVLPQLHASMYRLGEFVRSLEQIFSCQVTTNIYLTPEGNQGFPPHYDNHDVIVLQVSGRKKWRLYETAVDTPYRGERFEQSGIEAGPVSSEFTLEPGDFLYLPRGAMHDAENVGEEPSLHITVGFFTKKWADLMLEAISELALAQPAFRRSLPAGFATRDFDREAARRQFDELVDLVSDSAGMDGAFDVMADSFLRARRPNVSGTVLNPRPAADAGARFRRRRFVPWNVAADEEGRIVLIGPGGDIAFAQEDGDALETALSGEPFSLDQLKSSAPEQMLNVLWTHGYLERCQG